MSQPTSRTEPSPRPGPGAAAGVGPAGSVQVLLEGAHAVVELSGEVDADLGDDLLEAAADVEAANLPAVVRAGGVTFMDSTGVAFLARAASRSPGRLRLVDPPEMVRFLVDVTGVASLLDVVAGADGEGGTGGGGTPVPASCCGTGGIAAIVDPDPDPDAGDLGITGPAPRPDGPRG